MFDRVEKLIGVENLDKIKNKNILIVGIGGVGGFALESLIRTGIQNIIIIDYDKVDISNLNRQIITTSDNIGESKVKCASKRIKSINSNINITELDIKLDKNNIDILDNYNIDYIIDACDTIDTKIELYKYSTKNNIKIISSMGMANKLNPQNIIISTLDKTEYDPIAKILRKRLKEEGLSLKLPVVYSKEERIKKDGIYSVIFTPSVAGIYLAYYVINDIINS